MPPIEELELRGHAGLPLHCVLHGDATRTALVLPGAGGSENRLGGTPARPDLHYTGDLLREQGWSVLEVWWDADTLPDDREARDTWRLANAEAAIAGLAARGGELALLVGRSLGTVALAQLRASPERALLPSVWIVPLLQVERVRESLLAGGPRFLLCGGADAAYDANAAAAIERSGGEVVVLAGANHSLGVGDAPASARALADGLERMGAFLRRLAG